MIPKRGWFLLALTALVLAPAAAHAGKTNCVPKGTECIMEVDGGYESEYRAFFQQWRARNPKQPKEPKHDSVLFVRPGGGYIHSITRAEGQSGDIDAT